MNLEQFLIKHGVKEVRKHFEIEHENVENVVGLDVWVCDYRIKDPANKPIRVVPPKLVKVFSNDDLPKGKDVYYSPIHFREVKKGKILSTIIAPYDNTGYRSYPGASLNIFDSEKECNEFFNKQCDTAILQIEAFKKDQILALESRLNDIKEMKK